MDPFAHLRDEMAKLTVSSVTGPTEPALAHQTIGEFFKDCARNYGNLPAVISVHQNVKLSYRQLYEAARLMAANLSNKYGIGKGDKVALCAGNVWEYPALQIGLAMIGAILVPLNPAFTEHQFEHAIKHSQSKMLIVQSMLARGTRKPPRDMTDLIDSMADKIETVLVLDSTHRHAEDKFVSKHHAVASADTLLEPAKLKMCCMLKPEDTINMQFTSGTTSLPKIACLSHINLINNGNFIGSRMGLTATESNHPTGQDMVCVPVPMFHCFGLVLSNLACFATGTCLVYPSEAFDAEAALKAIREYNCTALHGVPTMFAAELEHDEATKGGLDSLRTGIAAGSSIPIEIMRRLSKTFGLDELTICYGMTETSPVSFMTFPHDPVELRTSTVGTIMPWTEARIVDPNSDSLEPLPINTPGEIVISGYLLQSGYHNDDVKTKEAMVHCAEKKRWMRTGDEGCLDESGYLRVTGRIKDLIIRGGENIHPLEVENVLFSHEAVSQASVVGVPDKKYGEAIAAFIVLEHHHKENPPSEATLKKFVETRLGHYMVPKYMFFVNDFPKTASGKIRKVDLRAEAQKLLNL